MAKKRAVEMQWTRTYHLPYSHSQNAVETGTFFQLRCWLHLYPNLFCCFWLTKRPTFGGNKFICWRREFSPTPSVGERKTSESKAGLNVFNVQLFETHGEYFFALDFFWWWRGSAASGEGSSLSELRFFRRQINGPLGCTCPQANKPYLLYQSMNKL